MTRRHCFVICALSLVSLPASAREPYARELDEKGNNNGHLDPQEIPPAQRLGFARYAALVGLDATKPMPLERLDEARIAYYRRLDGLNEPGSMWANAAGQRGFGRLNDKTGVRPFGDAGLMLADSNESVRRSTVGTFRNFDSNRDELLSREEVGRAYKRAMMWFLGDRNKDGLLTFAELSHYFAAQEQSNRLRRARDREVWNIHGVEVTPAQRRKADEEFRSMDKNRNGVVEGDEIPNAWRVDNRMTWVDTNRDGRLMLEEFYRGRARYVSSVEKQQTAAEKSDQNEKLDRRYCEGMASAMIRRYDTKESPNVLNRRSGEWRQMGQAVGADANNNGYITHEELTNWLFEHLSSQPNSNSPRDMPLWFAERDADLDGQVSLAEFGAGGDLKSIEEFANYDHNGDGLVTAEESTRRTVGGKRRFATVHSHVFEARKEFQSELVIAEDLTIADIDVHLAIAMNGDDGIQLHLVSPHGTRAALYTSSRSKPWGGGRLFDNTVIDEDAPEIRARLPYPPAHRSFRPQGMTNRALQSLGAFHGQSTQGTWRLIIHNNTRSPGLLEGWALFVKPKQ